MKRIFVAALALGFMATMSATPVSAQSEDPEVVACLEAIKEMSGGNPSGKAKALCEQKKLTEAIEEAMKPK